MRQYMKIEKRIKELRLPFAELAKAQGLYVPAKKFGSLITTSGQLPFQDQRLLFPGHVGKEVSIENAQRAAKASVLNCLAAIKSISGDLDKIKSIVRLNGFVCSDIGFKDQPQVINGASELLLDLFGTEVGSHTRCAIGAFELPLGSCVEIDLTVEV